MVDTAAFVGQTVGSIELRLHGRRQGVAFAAAVALPIGRKVETAGFGQLALNHDEVADGVAESILRIEGRQFDHVARVEGLPQIGAYVAVLFMHDLLERGDMAFGFHAVVEAADAVQGIVAGLLDVGKQGRRKGGDAGFAFFSHRFQVAFGLAEALCFSIASK